MQQYTPKEDILSYQGTVLFSKDKMYKFDGLQTKDELNCFRKFTEKEIQKYFIQPKPIKGENKNERG